MKAPETEKKFVGYGVVISAVTIAIPTYNRPIQLERALKSALKQSTRAKIIIVDNCSNDKYFSAIELLVKKYESEDISLYRNYKNLGMFGNFNICLNLCNTQWITFLCDDDELTEDCVKNFLRTKKPNSFVGAVRLSSINTNDSLMRRFALRILGLSKKLKKISYASHILTNKYSGLLAVFYNVEFLKKIGGFDVNRYPSSDYDLAVRISKENAFYVSNELGGIYHLEVNESANNSTLNEFILKDAEIIQNIMLNTGFDEMERSKFIGDVIWRRKKQYVENWNSKFHLESTTENSLIKKGISVKKSFVANMKTIFKIKFVK